MRRAAPPLLPALVPLLALLLALAVAGCGGSPRIAVPEGVAEADPRIGPCRREAAAAPALRELARRQPAMGFADAEVRWREEMLRAERDGFIACLVREGAMLQPVAGVEPVLSPRFGEVSPGPLLPPRALPQAPRPAPSGF